MSEHSEEPGRERGQAGNPEAGDAGDPKGQEGVGARNAEATPRIGEDANDEQTQTPAPDDEVGVPSDEKMGEEEEEA